MPITNSITRIGTNTRISRVDRSSQLAVLRILQRTEHDTLVHPQHVDGTEDDTADADDRRGAMHAERAEQDEELADEPVETRQADRRQHHHHEDGGVHRQLRPQAAELGDQPGVTALVDHADAEEQRAGRQAVVEHLVDAALHAFAVERRHAQHDEAQMAHRGVRDQPLEIGLHHARPARRRRCRSRRAPR